MNRNKVIFKNTIIFFIGNFGSKILAYIMVLVYTHYITTSDLGYYDLILTTVSLLQPLISMAFDEGEYRWLIGAEQSERQSIIATCIKTVFLTCIGAIGILIILDFQFHFRYVGLIGLYVVSLLIYQMFLNAVRGMTNNKLYAISGIINSGFLLALELFGLIVLKLGIEALLASAIIANVLTIIVIYNKQKEFHGLIRKKYDKVLAKKIFQYSMPLVPNQISWWIVNFSDRYIILFFLGTSFNGIYAISNKFPTIVTTITGIIYLALQETVIKEYDSLDRDVFYSKVFKNYFCFLFSIVMCAIPATKIVIEWFVSSAYTDAYKYMNFLYISTVFSALSSFLGIGYQISKETKRSIRSTISAAAINMLINIILINQIGLHAASLSTMISYMILFIIRMIHSQKYFSLNVEWMRFFALLILTLTVSAISYYTSVWLNLGLLLIVLLFALVFNRKMIMKITKLKG